MNRHGAAANTAPASSSDHFSPKLTLWIGWGALVLSVLVPLIVSVLSWLQTRDLHCTNDFSYTFAPLLVTCGERSQAILILGWILTVVTVGGLALAVVVAIMAAVRFSAADRAGSWVFAATVAAVLVAVFGILATDPDRGGVNAWILYTSAASALVLVVGGIAGVAVALRRI